MHKFLWPLLVLNLSVPVWFDDEEHILFKITQLLSYLAILDGQLASCHAKHRWPTFGVKIEAEKHKVVHIFHFLPTFLVCEIVNPFSRIFDAISSDKSWLISTWRQDTRIFPACWILIGQFKFPARQPYVRPWIRRLSPQYDRQSKFWCPNETIQ